MALSHSPAGMYLLKVNNSNARTRCVKNKQRHQNDAMSAGSFRLLIDIESKEQK